MTLLICKRMFLPVGLAVLAASGCTTPPQVEDGADDAFLGDGSKEDAFGVEDWSPDGAAVLSLVSTATQSQLDDDVGLSSRVAKGIVDHRQVVGGTYTDLRDLDAVPYVGKAVFGRLLTYATEHKLFKTAVRVPLIVENEDDDSLTPITTFNEQARAAGVTQFARYTFIDATTDYSDKMERYDQRLAELASKAGIPVPGTMLLYAYSLSDYNVGSDHVCFIGDPNEVSDVVGAHADDLVGDMYSIWAYRYGDTKWVYDDTIDDADFGPEFTDYDTSSSFVRLIATDDDDGTHDFADDVPPCR